MEFMQDIDIQNSLRSPKDLAYSEAIAVFWSD